MRNTRVAGRHLATRLLAVQVVMGVVLAACFLIQGISAASAAFVGCMTVTVGTMLTAWGALARGPAEMVLMRVMVTTLLKWMMVLVGLYVVMAVLKWPPIPAIVGVALAVVVNVVALKFKEQ